MFEEVERRHWCSTRWWFSGIPWVTRGGGSLQERLVGKDGGSGRYTSLISQVVEIGASRLELLEQMETTYMVR